MLTMPRPSGTRGAVMQVEHRWACPNCPLQKVTTHREPHTPFHACAGLKGLTAPLVPAGTNCKVEAVERGDWVGREKPQVDGEGRPVMAIVTTRDDGQDCAVLAPQAIGSRTNE